MPETVHNTLWRSLPEVYRDEGTDGFTYRLLGLFGTMLEQMEDKVLAVRRLLSPYETDPEFLPWLASWVAFTLDENWPVEKRRELIARAVSLYGKRGRPDGVREMVEIYTGIAPELDEHFGKGPQVGVRATVGVDFRVYGSQEENAHRFTVTIRSTTPFNKELRNKVIAVVLREKPSHTQLVYARWEPEIEARVGVVATVGIDFIVGG